MKIDNHTLNYLGLIEVYLNPGKENIEISLDQNVDDNSLPIHYALTLETYTNDKILRSYHFDSIRVIETNNGQYHAFIDENVLSTYIIEQYDVVGLLTPLFKSGNYEIYDTEDDRIVMTNVLEPYYYTLGIKNEDSFISKFLDMFSIPCESEQTVNDFIAFNNNRDLKYSISLPLQMSLMTVNGTTFFTISHDGKDTEQNKPLNNVITKTVTSIFPAHHFIEGSLDLKEITCHSFEHFAVSRYVKKNNEVIEVYCFEQELKLHHIRTAFDSVLLNPDFKSDLPNELSERVKLFSDLLIR